MRSKWAAYRVQHVRRSRARLLSMEPEAAQSYSFRERGIPPRQSSSLQSTILWEISKMAALSINGQTHQVDVDPNTPLLWALRDTIGLTGTKYGCGIAQCGACTVHMDGVAMRSCSVPVSAAEGKQITADIDANISNICRCGTYQQVRAAIHAAASA